MSHEACNSGITAMLLGDFEEAAAQFLNAVRIIKCEVANESSRDDDATSQSEATAQNQCAKVSESVLQEDSPTQRAARSSIDLNLELEYVRLFTPIQVSTPQEKQFCGLRRSQSDLSAEPCISTRSRSDEVDRIYTCAISSSCVTAAPDVNDDKVLFEISVTSAALLYNAALSFHFLWLERGHSSILRRALKYYHAARSILRAAFPIDEVLNRRFMHKDQLIAFVSQCCPLMHLENAIFAWLAILNNMNAIYFELVEGEQVDNVREEMRKLLLIFDPLIAFGPQFDDTACSIIYMNAFFYQDNKDMVIARAA